MTSTFGWLAIDPEQRRRMMEAVDQFRDETTLDDLGFGAIRDAFSNTLFPGVSSIQTRIRYVLFIPWLLQEASHRDTVGRMQSQFREDEFRLIKALQSGKESLGVIGRDAGRSLQRLPSEIYWGAPRQEDLIRYLGDGAEKFRIDLSPPSAPGSTSSPGNETRNG